MGVTTSVYTLITIEDNKIKGEMQFSDVDCDFEISEYQEKHFKEQFGLDLRKFVLDWADGELEIYTEDDVHHIYQLVNAFSNGIKHLDSEGREMILLGGDAY